MSTTGIELKTRRRGVAETVELLSSMRFAITLLVMIAIAAIIGTIMQQDRAMPDYVNQFGPFWFEVFRKLSLYTVYSAWWFLLILAFLIVSTSLCIARNAPKFIRDMRSWRDSVREESLRNFHHRSEWTAPLDMVPLAQQTASRLVDAGYKTKMVDKAGGVLVAAKKGAGNKFGYIFAHTAIIVILLGGLLDSNLPIRFQQWFMGKTPYAGTGLISAIPPQHRLGLGNPTFRGNTMIPEGQASDTALLQQADGVLVQDLPFTIELRKFIIDFYSTGMPKLFASEVVIRDHETGKAFPATIKVNEPLIYRGIAVYQSSFEDGGSKLKLTGWPMTGTSDKSFSFEGEVGNATELKQGADVYSVEWSGFRPFNVENTSQNNDARAVTKGKSLEEQFAQTLSQHSGSAAKNVGNKDLKNVGPSVQYKLRDKTGQAREYLNYMQPVTLEGHQVFLAGVRNNPSDQFSFLRIPADDEHGLREWMRLRAALADPSLREEAARRYAARALPPGDASGALSTQLQESAAKTLAIFAGDGNQGGYLAVSKFLERIPAAEQEKAATVFMKMLNGAMWELWQAARARAGEQPATPTEAHGRFLQQATNALSDSFFYGAPVFLALDDFKEVKASVLQVTRSPGKKVVYVGCLLLVLGIFSMFYIRERRVWVWVKPAPDGGTHALMAMSTQRKTLDFEREFEDLKTKLPQSA
ncbi:cytochrome c biogenesis protein ResB [Massilia sp. NEAU-DD11]|jgi:cytochrome c biogenesis protein|uniref:Cytochrome c biogenesis protein ResB n=1 Tax=Massilia cellulosiltytica TaxID=2683234 RepID=A0A7X3FVH8_9BURK|nr:MULTISPECIES: cytochrome c biogenesis protein ResB [Telluria group]KQZ47623.1 cytochrome C biogenesis protein ResB [Massilia sp. Root1485]MVW58618.1 cytochrome c biogenesis protein ResB [Telluria cellulosilytica]